MEFDELRKKLIELHIQNRVTVIFQRTCKEGDWKSAVDIIHSDENICALIINPRGRILNIEKYITTDDKEFNKEARKVLLNKFCAGC